MQEQEQRVPRKPLRIAKKPKAISSSAQPAFELGDEFYELAPRDNRPPETRSHPFRIDSPRYHTLLEMSQQPMLAFDPADLDGEALDDINDCVCNAA